MKNIKKTALFCAATVAAIALLVGTAMTVNRAMSEKSRYSEAEKRLALADLYAALDEMQSAIEQGDVSALNFSAGKAEAYLSRAGIDGCGDIYREIRNICAGSGGAEDCRRLADAVRKAASGDGAAFRDYKVDETSSSYTEETTEDGFTSKMMKRLGKSRDEVAFRRAQAFACPNAEFDECKSNSTSFAYSGENVFILISGAEPRVVLYCFDRDSDDRYSVTQEEAERSVELIIKKEKLRLGEHVTTEENGIRRTVCYGKDDLCATPLVTLEIYSDTGRLRLYDASNYYKYQS